LAAFHLDLLIGFKHFFFYQGGARGMHLDDLVLVETDPKSGETVANHEKDPTKWGDWQHGGRVSDF